MMYKWNEVIFHSYYIFINYTYSSINCFNCKTYKTVGKVDQVVEDVNYKVNKLNGLFEIVIIRLIH